MLGLYRLSVANPNPSSINVPYFDVLTAIYRGVGPQRPFSEKGLWAQGLLKGGLVGLKSWHAKTLSANQDFWCQSPYYSENGCSLFRSVT